jgi:hypothetical protein
MFGKEWFKNIKFFELGMIFASKETSLAAMKYYYKEKFDIKKHKGYFMLVIQFFKIAIIIDYNFRKYNDGFPCLKIGLLKLKWVWRRRT